MNSFLRSCEFVDKPSAATTGLLCDLLLTSRKNFFAPTLRAFSFAASKSSSWPNCTL